MNFDSENGKIPHLLLEAVKKGRAVILLGAGASCECKIHSGNFPPDAAQLRDTLAKKYLDTSNEERDLPTVAELAIAGGASEPEVFDEINSMFDPFSTSDAHKALPLFSWRGIATTNYDTFVEDAYAAVDNGLQTCVPFVKDIEPYEGRLHRENNAVPYLKLHGCLNHRLDRDIPLVLSHEHQHNVSKNRQHLFERLKHWASESHLVFLGYRMADSHIRSLIYKLNHNVRPKWYIVTPSADVHDIRYWNSKNVEIIRMTFGDFMLRLQEQVPKNIRVLSSVIDSEKPPYRVHFHSNTTESQDLQKSLQFDIEYIHDGIAFNDIPPKDFYAGYDDGFCGIVRKYDFARKTGENLLYKAADYNKENKEPQFFLLLGSAGSGKTIALKRAAFDVASELKEVVFWLRDNGVPRVEVFEELHALTSERIFLFVDSVSLYADDVLNLLISAKTKKIPVTVVASERHADWGTYCDNLEEKYPPELLHLGNLSKIETEQLVDLLRKHECLGLLSSKSREEQVDAFMHKDRSDRQLLVALHELTLGKPFEEILNEEYQRIQPEVARRLYLDIATMHQFGIVARAGVISRISRIQFEDFRNKFFQPLMGIVKIGEDVYTGDRSYRTRHARVAEIVFGRICQHDEEKASQLCRILEGIDIGYSSDRRMLVELCKGRKLATKFIKIDSAREIFETVFETSPNEAFLFQQAAILEYSHREGCLERAEMLAQKAREIDGNNHIYIHTLSEIARRMANEDIPQVRKDHLRSRSRNLLGEIMRRDSRKELSYCKINVDEVIELAKRITGESLEYVINEFDTKLDDTTMRLTRGKQEHPDEAEFSETEAYLWKHLGELDKSTRSLTNAIRARTRHKGVFIRLARIQRQSASMDDCIATLNEGLERFHHDKDLHLEMALALFEALEGPDESIEYHFKSSYSPGDNKFDSRFFFAEYLFWVGRIEDAQAIFDEIDQLAPDKFRPNATKQDDLITGRIVDFSGIVISRKERYFFINSGSLPNAVFAHYSSIRETTYDEIKVGGKVKFRVRFNRKGPVAVDVWLQE